MEVFKINYIYTVFLMMLINNILVYVLSRTPGFGKTERWIFRLLLAVCVCDLSDAFGMLLKYIAGPAILYVLDAVFLISIAFISFFLFYYSENMYGSDVFKNRCSLFLLHIPIDLLAILLIISYWKREIYSFSVILILANVYNVVSIILSGWRLCTEKDLEKRKILWESIYYIVPFFIGSILQCFFDNLPWANAALTITILLMFIHNQERLLRKKTEDAEMAVRAKSEFLSRMSHDIRTPINGMMGMLDIAQSHLEDPENIDLCFSKMRGAADQLLSITNDILDMSKLETGDIQLIEEPFDIASLVDSTLAVQRIIASEKGVKLEQHVDNEIIHPYVCGSPNYVRSILVNIISNAIKYTNTGGTISCNVLQESCKKEDWCNMIITITDNGIGMSEEFQKHIFEDFERERNSTASHIEGSGIGMGITKKLVELMNGTIEVKSKQGEGSSFTVTVSCRKALKEDTLEKKNTNLHNKNCLNGVRILLVEDNEINTEIARELLTEEGCIVETADDGVACVDMIERADADYYKMILMDIQMPIMNGYDATLAIRKMKDTKKARIPIIAMTANAFAEDIQKVLSVGMNDHVAKPVDMNILVSTMMKYL